jgi:hypothetical protein
LASGIVWAPLLWVSVQDFDGQRDALTAADAKTDMVAFVHAAQVLARRAAARNLNLICDLRDALVGRAPAASPSRRGTVTAGYHLSFKNDNDLPIVR